MEMLKSKNNKEGFTLIEVLVAASIAAFLAITISQLLTRADRIVDQGRETLIATNIAREGLELVRAKRDTNWFQIGDGSKWLANGLCEENGNDYTNKDRTFILDARMVRDNDGIGGGQGLLYIHDNGEWLHEPTGKGVTPYSRQISIDCSTKNEDVPYITVTSSVIWKSGTKDQQVVVKEKLYNWYIPSAS